MPSNNPLINFVIEPKLLSKVEDFRFEHRFSSRASAMKWLISAALDGGPLPGIENRDDRDCYIPRRSRRPR